MSQNKPRSININRLREMREGAGITMRELGEILGRDHSCLVRAEQYPPGHHSLPMYHFAYKGALASVKVTEKVTKKTITVKP